MVSVGNRCDSVNVLVVAGVTGTSLPWPLEVPSSLGLSSLPSQEEMDTLESGADEALPEASLRSLPWLPAACQERP